MFRAPSDEAENELSLWKYRSFGGQEGNRRASSAVSVLERLTVDL